MNDAELFGKKYSWPVITDQMLNAVQLQMRESISIYDGSGIIKELEQKMGRYYGKRHALLTSSGTAALQSAYYSLLLSDSDEIISCSYGFFATISPLLHFHGKVILVDCDKYGNIDVHQIKKNISQNTKAIVITDMWGCPVDNYNEIVSLCRKNNIVLIEDASHCHGGKINNEPVGFGSDILIMSLQGNKIVTGGEGGILLTNDDDLFYKAVFYGHYNKRCKKQIPIDHYLSKFSKTGAGLKLRIHPVAARMASVMFDDMTRIVDERSEFAEILNEKLSGNPLIKLINPPSDAKHSWYAYTFVYQGDMLTGVSTADFVEKMRLNGIADADQPGSTGALTRCPIFQETIWKRRLHLNEDFFIVSYENAEFLSDHLIKLPCWQKEWLCMADFYAKVINKITQEILENTKLD